MKFTFDEIYILIDALELELDQFDDDDPAGEKQIQDLIDRLKKTAARRAKRMGEASCHRNV